MYHYDYETKQVTKQTKDGVVLATYKVRFSDKGDVVTVYENGKPKVLQLWKIIAVEKGIIPDSELSSSTRGRGKYRCHRMLTTSYVTNGDEVIGEFKSYI